ncbi:MAG: hypothetical protein J3Q66DRAFT_174118 [Benniella sp.]|nr:MAG: hypothetical protein J3Q66DRAFT_174118 [Benniella sp.]
MRAEMDWSFAFIIEARLEEILEAHGQAGSSDISVEQPAVDPREASLAILLLRPDPFRVSHIYNVGDKIDSGSPEYVVVMQDQSYFCTYLLLHNMGIVCRHFFCVMQSYPCVYHPHLVLKHWFREDWQDAPDFEARVASEPFIMASPHRRRMSNFNSQPESSYMSDVRSLFAVESAVPAPRKAEQLKRRRFAEVAG